MSVAVDIFSRDSLSPGGDQVYDSIVDLAPQPLRTPREREMDSSIIHRSDIRSGAASLAGSEMERTQVWYPRFPYFDPCKSEEVAGD